MTGLAPEQRLVLLLCRARLDGPARDEAGRLLARELSWPAILALVRGHGVLPLFARNLESLAPVPLEVPRAIRRELADAQRLNAARAALMARGLADVLGRLAAAGIPAIPLKGPALAESLHADATLRECSDLDLLVPIAEVPRAFDLLLSAGYAHGEDGPVARHELAVLLETNMEHVFVGRTGGLTYPLELHWDIAWRWRGDRRAVDDLWADARPATFHGARAYALSPEWQLIYLAVHAARHRWQALKWLVDIHELCATTAMDWARVDDTARRFGWRRLVAVTLTACDRLLGTRIPPGFALSRLPPWVTLFPATPPATAAWREALFPLHLVPGVSAKLAYLGRLVLQPTLAEHRLLRLPRGVSLLYSPLRLLRLGGKWGWPLAQAGLGRVRRARTQ